MRKISILVCALLAMAPLAPLAGAQESDEPLPVGFEAGFWFWVVNAYEEKVGNEPTVTGEPQRFDDVASDVENPFGRSFDSLDSTLATGWDALWGDWFLLDAPITPNDALSDFAFAVYERVEPVDDYEPQGSGYTFYGRYGMVEDVEPPAEEACSVSVYARHPDLPTTLQVEITDDNDPAKDMNVTWRLWVLPDGTMHTDKRVVNPETRLTESVTGHSTLGAVAGNEIVLMFPGSELEGVEKIRMAAACFPRDAQDIGRYTRDRVGEIDVGPADLAPIVVFEAPTDTGSTTTTVASATGDLGGETSSDDVTPVATGDDDTGEDIDWITILLIAFGFGATGAGAWAYRRAGNG